VAMIMIRGLSPSLLIVIFNHLMMIMMMHRQPKSAETPQRQGPRSASDSMDDAPMWFGDVDMGTEMKERAKLRRREKERKKKNHFTEALRKVKARERGRDLDASVDSRVKYLAHFGVKPRPENRALNNAIKKLAISKIIAFGMQHLHSLDVLNLVTLLDRIATKSPNWLSNASGVQRHGFEQILNRLQKKIKQLSPQGLSRVVHSLATLGYALPDTFAKELETRMMSGVSKFRAKEIVTSTWGLAKLGYGNRKKLRQSLETVTTRFLSKMSNNEISRSMWALSAFAQRDDLRSMAKGGGSSGTMPEINKTCLSRLLSITRVRLKEGSNHTWSAQDAADILEAVEGLDHRPHPNILSRIERRLVRTESPLNISSSSLNNAPVAGRLIGLSPKHHVTILRTLASMSHRFQNASTSITSGYTRRYLDSYSTRDVCDLYWAHKRLDPNVS